MGICIFGETALHKEKEYLIKLQDGGIINIDYDYEYLEGCETCDYGSQYITRAEVLMGNRIEKQRYLIEITTTQEYEYMLNHSRFFQLWVCNIDIIKNMTQLEFMKWLKDNVSKLRDDHMSEDRVDVVVNFRCHDISKHLDEWKEIDID